MDQIHCYKEKEYLIAIKYSFSLYFLYFFSFVFPQESSIHKIDALIENNSAQLSSKQYSVDKSYRIARQQLIGYVPHVAIQTLWQTSGSWPTVPSQQTTFRVDQLLFSGYGPFEKYYQGLYDMHVEQQSWNVARNNLFFESAQKSIFFDRQKTIQEYRAATTYFAQLDLDRTRLAKEVGLATEIQQDVAIANAQTQEALLKQPQRNQDALTRELWMIANTSFDFEPIYNFDLHRTYTEQLLIHENVNSLTTRAKEYNPLISLLNERIEKADYTARVLPRAYLPKVVGYFNAIDQKVPRQLDYLDFPKQWSLGIALEWEFDGWKHIDNRNIAQIEKLQLECERLQTVNTFEKDITESYATIANITEQIVEKEKIIAANMQVYEQQKAFLSVGLASRVDETEAYTKVKRSEDERNELYAKMSEEYERIRLITGCTLQ